MLRQANGQWLGTYPTALSISPDSFEFADQPRRQDIVAQSS